MIRWRPRVAGRSDAENGRERGMVTAELAVALPALIFVLLVAVNAILIGVDQVRCVDASRVGARAASRGDSLAAVTTAAKRVAPRNARILVERSPGAAGTATVTVTAAAPGPFGWLTGGRSLRGSVTSAVEPTMGGIDP